MLPPLTPCWLTILRSLSAVVAPAIVSARLISAGVRIELKFLQLAAFGNDAESGGMRALGGCALKLIMQLPPLVSEPR